MKDATIKTVIHTDINHTDYVIHAKIINEAVIEVEVFIAATGWDDMEGNNPSYPKRNAIHGLDVTTDLEEAERILTGTIKWDGCSDINFFPDSSGYQHFCGKRQASAMGEILAGAYEIARSMMPETCTDNELFEGS